MSVHQSDHTEKVNHSAAVLMSGGSDSAILAVELARSGVRVYPIYIRFGLRWEDLEFDYACRFLNAVEHPLIQPIVSLNQPMDDVYGNHWSREGRVPDAASEDDAVYLPGRNILLISKAAVWCSFHDVHEIYSGVLSGNPFPDASQEFFDHLTTAISLGLNWPIRIVRPYATLKKVDVLKRGADLPLELTFSCLNPSSGQHCGDCNKCEERRKALAMAGLVDRTPYLIVRTDQNS